MKYPAVLLVLLACESILPSLAFANSENFYSLDHEASNVSGISSLDYPDLKKDIMTAAISNGEITKFDFDTDSVILQVDMQGDGLLYVNIPKDILYLADHDCNSDAFVLVDGEEASNVLDKILEDGSEFQNAFIPDKNVKTWAIDVAKDSEYVEIVFAFIIPDAAYSYAFGQRCLMMESGEFMKPLTQKNLGLELHQIICRDDLMLTYKKESRPACVTDDTFIELFERDWKTLLFLPGDWVFPNTGQFSYGIIGDAKILDVVNYPDSRITKISIDAEKKSNLMMTLERDFSGIDLFREGRAEYSVLIDGEKSAFREPWGKNEYRTNFQLNMPAGTETITVSPK